MKTARVFCALAAAGLAACSWSHQSADPGNPNRMAYAGEAGSTYDRAANPPRDIGTVAYNPNGPIDRSLPADERLPTATNIPPAAVTAQPLAPLPGTTLGNRPRAPL